MTPGPFFVRIFIHVIRDSSGQGGQTPEQVEEALGYLDKAFNPHDIYFVRDCDIIYHNEQICYEALSISTAGVGTGNCLMPPLPNLPNGVNVYLVPDHYTDTYAGAATAFRVPSHALAIIGLIDTIIGNLSQVRSYTFAHEMGHCLGLYHTHFGTGESGGGAGTCLGLEECADGTNCGSAGDYICDTPAEPILFDIVTQNFLVDIATCQWTENDVDNCNGTLYDPDEFNIMSYSWPQCYQYFTEGQGRRMRRHLAESPTISDVVVVGTRINSDTTWNTPVISIDDILIIKSGNTLTIGANTTVKFTQQGRVIIEPGARLILDGKLTNNDCANAWKGVEVWGNTAASQKATGGVYQQGRFVSRSGAVVQNADIGVQLWGPDAALGSGGIINCNGTTFQNCRQGVAFAPYIKFVNDTVPVAYSAVFTGCAFIVDGNYPHYKPFDSHANLRGVRGVDFVGCRFLNQQIPASATTPADFGYGIFAYDAGFRVLPQCNGPITTGGCQSYTNSEFTGLGYGIWLGNDKYVPIAHTVKQADFRNCYGGIVNSGVSGGLMVLNNFYLGELPGQDLGTPQYGVALGNNLNGFTLEENAFYKSGDALTFGIGCANLGGFNNVIRRNTFNDVTVSNFAFLQNAENGDIPRGLYYDCNTNQNTERYDFLVFGSIKSEQGLEIGDPPNVTYGPSGNKFAYTGSPDDRDFSNTGSSVNYYYYQSGTDEKPEDYSGIIPTVRQFANPCESNYCAPPCETPTKQTQRKQQYYTAKSSYVTALADYQTAVQTENPELAAAKSKLAGYHRKQMDVHAYSIVSHLLHDTTVFHRDTFRVWLGNLDTYGARISLAGDYWAAGDTTSANSVLNGISTAYTLTEAQSDDFQRVKYLFGKLYGKNIYNLSQIIIDELEVFAADTTGYAVGMSQTILRLYGRDYPPIGFLPGEERGQKQSDKKATKAVLAKKGVWVYPNPATDHVIFDFQDFSDKASIQIEITDLSGRFVWSRSVPEKEENIVVWNTAGTQPGVYFFRIVTGKDANSGKIYLQK